jgi:fermentation-respiration switch protein FrsA (DUF1100 family)
VNINRPSAVIAACLLALSVTACAAADIPTLPDNPAPAATATPPPATATPEPTAAEALTLAPTDTATPTFTPTPTHPLMIEVMRQQAYPGSDLVFEEVLAPAANYDQFIVSYLSEGNRIYALLTIPRGERPATGWPVIIFNHGYIPPDVYRTTERYVAYVDGFARSGYIVLKSDYRGHGSSEGEATGGYGSPAYTIDVLNAIASVKRLPDADPNRIGMWGHSMGGHITLRAMVVNNDIKAGVVWGGVVASYPDLIQNWRRGPAGAPTPTPNPAWVSRGRWRTELIDTYGSFEENQAFWASISATTYLADLSGPIQLHHGMDDTSVPVEFSENLYGDLQAAGAYAELYTYPGTDHNLSQSFTIAMGRSIAFFDQWVKGEN